VIEADIGIRIIVFVRPYHQNSNINLTGNKEYFYS
jgi:hypothetical protein